MTSNFPSAHHFSRTPFPSSLISLFLSSRSTLSANSSLSAVQKWLCLADSADKRLNACCPQKRRRSRRGKVLGETGGGIGGGWGGRRGRRGGNNLWVVANVLSALRFHHSGLASCALQYPNKPPWGASLVKKEASLYYRKRPHFFPP